MGDKKQTFATNESEHAALWQTTLYQSLHFNSSLKKQKDRKGLFIIFTY